MSLPLDKRKPYGTITPPFWGASISQRGSDGRERYYRQDGTRVMILGEEPDPDIKGSPPPPPGTPAEATAPPAAKKAPPPKKKGKQPPKATVTRKGIVTEVEALDPNAPDITLAAWAKGDAKRPFEDVRVQIKDELDVDVEDEVEAASALIKAGVVKVAEVKVV